MSGQTFIARRTFLSSLGAACALGLLIGGAVVHKRAAQVNNTQGEVLRVENDSVAKATSLLLGGTKNQIQWRGKEAIRIGQYDAYDANHRGFEYYVDDDIPMVSAPDYRPPAGLHVITWVVKDNANRNHPILSFPVYFGWIAKGPR